jgi:hypothetical protein
MEIENAPLPGVPLLTICIALLIMPPDDEFGDGFGDVVVGLDGGD